MAIALKFINVIIPTKKIIKLKGNNWWQDYLTKNNRLIRETMWYDDCIFRDGAMNMDDIECIIKFWEDQGLEPKKVVNGIEQWNDLCVVDSFDGPTLPCDWLEVEYVTTKQNVKVVHHVSYIGDKNKEVIGPSIRKK